MSDPVVLRELVHRINMGRQKFIDEQFRILLNPKPKLLADVALALDDSHGNSV